MTGRSLYHPRLMLNALRQHRSYIARSAWRDVRHRHVGSVAGASWNVIRPLATIAVFTIVFGSIMSGRSTDGFGGVMFTLYLCSALLPWTALAETLNRGTTSLVHSAGFLRKLPIPEEVFVAQHVVSAAISLAISMGLLFVLSPLLGHMPTWTWLALPVPLTLMLLFGFGMSMALGTVFVFMRDVRQLVEIALHLGFWTVPIVYDPDLVPAWFRATFAINPVYPFLESTRQLFLYGRMPGPDLWLLMVLWTVGACAAGSLILDRLRDEIRDNL
jgi:ABC-type polysaccharide/polyol phosphate export permease